MEKTLSDKIPKVKFLVKLRTRNFRRQECKFLPKLSIPMHGIADSLNVSAAVLIYDALRRRNFS